MGIEDINILKFQIGHLCHFIDGSENKCNVGGVKSYKEKSPQHQQFSQKFLWVHFDGRRVPPNSC